MAVNNGLKRHGAIDTPPAITADPGAVQILSVWLSSDKTNMVLVKPDTWEDLEPWALLLADISRYIAHVHAVSTTADAARTIVRIRSIFDAELDNPTGPPSEGSFG